VLEGDPKKEGFFTMRAKLPAGYQIPAHYHPCPERVTVLSGTFNRRYAWTEGETVLQIGTIGPWGITYVNPTDDPRKK
jgi:quercetin dioxygenase-like cupin family protein